MEFDVETRSENGIIIVRAATSEDWRKWLEENGQREKSVRLVIYHVKSGTPSVRIEEAIDEAICFGWVDSKIVKRDPESYYLLLSPRNPKSTWGKISKERAELMIRLGRMTPYGQAVIDQAKANGAWNALDAAHALIIPADLQAEFDKNETAYGNFEAFSESSKRNILEWILKAKKAETRRHRIAQTVALAFQNKKAL